MFGIQHEAKSRAELQRGADPSPTQPQERRCRPLEPRLQLAGSANSQGPEEFSDAAAAQPSSERPTP